MHSDINYIYIQLYSQSVSRSGIALQPSFVPFKGVLSVLVSDLSLYSPCPLHIDYNYSWMISYYLA